MESDLIKKHKPKYNVSLKDDKSPLYIRITNDKYKRVLSARKTDLEKEDSSQFGPYPSSSQVTQILKMLRQIFPYSTHLPTKNTCLYHQMKLCVPCPSLIEITDDEDEKDMLIDMYRENTRNVIGLKSMDWATQLVTSMIDNMMGNISKSGNESLVSKRCAVVLNAIKKAGGTCSRTIIKKKLRVTSKELDGIITELIDDDKIFVQTARIGNSKKNTSYYVLRKDSTQ